MNDRKLKTYEQTVIDALRDPRLKNSRIHYAFQETVRHFRDVDYLKNERHLIAIEKIYLEECYKRQTVAALARSLFLDVKKLNENRKDYLHLIAKNYFEAFAFDKENLTLLYFALKKEKEHADRTGQAFA